MHRAAVAVGAPTVSIAIEPQGHQDVRPSRKHGINRQGRVPFFLLLLTLASFFTKSTDATRLSAATATPITVVVTFDNPVPSGSSGSLLNGVFQGIDFGTGNWRWEGPWTSDTSNNVYFASSTGTSRQFTFSGGSQILNGLHATTDTAGTLTLSDNLGQIKTQTIVPGSMQWVTTGWTRASTVVTVFFSAGWSLALDDITYSNPSGTSITSSQLTAYPTAVSFGYVAVGSSSSRTETLSNTGTGSVTISKARASGAGFGLSGLTLPLTLSAGQSRAFSVTFTPTSAGSVTGTISVVSNASNSPASIALSGTGTTGLLSDSPTAVSFGNVAVGSSSSRTETLSNTGTGSVTISKATASGAGFGLSGLTLPLTLSAGQSSTFSVSFTPTSAGSVTGTISVVSNASNSPASIALSGTGTPGLLSVSPSSLSFGSVTINTKSILSATLTNTGTASITISQASVSGAGFSFSGLSLPLSLAVGQNASFSVAFAPAVVGTVSGTLAFVSTTSNTSAVESLSGTGANAHSVHLSWTATSSSGVSGYNVYSGMVSGGPYTKLNASPVAGTTYTDTTVLAGKTYYYVVTAINSQGMESVYSAQVQAVVPSP